MQVCHGLPTTLQRCSAAPVSHDPGIEPGRAGTLHTIYVDLLTMTNSWAEGYQHVLVDARTQDFDYQQIVYYCAPAKT